MQSFEKESKDALENMNKEFQIISLAHPAPFKEGDPDIETLIKQYEGHLNLIKNSVELTTSDLTKVAKVEAMIDMCNQKLPEYFDIATKMKQDKDTWKN